MCRDGRGGRGSGLSQFNLESVWRGEKGSRRESWSGTFHNSDELADGKYDVLMADLTITKDRMMKIDFSMPIENYGVVIILKKASSLENNMFVFLNSLSFEVWMCGAGALTLVIGVLWVIVQLRHEANPSLSHCAWLCVASLVGQGTEDVPRSGKSLTVIYL